MPEFVPRKILHQVIAIERKERNFTHCSKSSSFKHNMEDLLVISLSLTNTNILGYRLWELQGLSGPDGDIETVGKVSKTLGSSEDHPGREGPAALPGMV